MVSSPGSAVAEKIAQKTGQQVKPITVTKMVGNKDVAAFMRLVASAQKSTRRMGMAVR